MTDETKGKLIKLATARHGIITHCPDRASLDACFIEEEELGETLFWFNDMAGSTHLLYEHDVK